MLDQSGHQGVVDAQGDPTDEALSFGRMPAAGGACEQALGASRLDGGDAIGDADAMLFAVGNHATVGGTSPELKEATLLKLKQLGRAGTLAATHHPLQPLVPESMYEKIKQTSKADTNDWINAAAVLVPFMDELVLEESSDLEASSIESRLLSFSVVGVDGVEVDFG